MPTRSSTRRARGSCAVAVGHVERFQPGVRKVREMGLSPRFIECHRLAPFSFRSLTSGSSTIS
jgi:hypothetical protein